MISILYYIVIAFTKSSIQKKSSDLGKDSLKLATGLGKDSGKPTDTDSDDGKIGSKDLASLSSLDMGNPVDQLSLPDKMPASISVLSINTPTEGDQPDEKKHAKATKAGKKHKSTPPSVIPISPISVEDNKEKEDDKSGDDKKGASNAFDNQEILMTSSTYQPQIAKSLMDLSKDKKDKVEISNDVLSKLESLVNGELSENVSKINSSFSQLSKTIAGLAARNDDKEKENDNKMKGSSDRLDLRIIEVGDDKKRTDST